MKKLLKSLMLFAAAAMALTSCENEAMNEGIEANDTVTMTFVAGAPESKTAVSIDGNTATYTWSTGDKVGFYYVAVEGTGKKKAGSNNATIAEDGTATFTASFDKIEGASAYNVGAFYPSDSWGNHADENPFNNVKVQIPFGQALTPNTFDPTADLMIAHPFMGIELKSDNTKTLNFHRIAAIGKMNLKLEGMENGEVIKSVKFSLAEGTHFNGPVSLDMEKSTYTLGAVDTKNFVELTGDLAANADRTAIFFTCFPGEYSGAYTIEVKTDKATYKKEATLSKALSFTEGNVLNFNATVGNREEIVVEEGSTVDVLNREFTGIASGAGYNEWSGKGTSGAVYAGQSAGGNGSIQLRTTNSNSGIITTTSGGTVKKVVVTWNSSTSDGRTLNIYGKHTAYTAATELYDSATSGDLLGTIKYGTSTELVIAGDYEFIGLRSASGAMYISEIQITWGGAGAGGEGGETPDPTPDPEEPETPEDGTVTFDFSKPANYGFTTPDAGAGTEIETGKLVAAPITMTATSGGTATRFWNSNGTITLRAYKGNSTTPNGTFTFTADSGYTITGIDLSGMSGTITPNVGTFTNSKWTGSATSVTFEVTANATLKTATITYESAGGSTEPEEPETPVVKADRNLDWSADTATATVGEAFTAPTLTGTKDGVTYSSSNTGVATINADGIVTIVAAGTTTIKATAAETETLKADEASYTLTVSAAQSGGGESVLFSEDFASITSGNSTSTSGSNSAWNGNTNFSSVTKAYQAGGAVRLGAGSATGSLVTKTLDLSGGTITVSVDVKGWSSVEGKLNIKIGNTQKAITYSETMSKNFGTYTVTFTNSEVGTGTNVTIATSAKRAFVDNIIITKQ